MTVSIRVSLLILVSAIPPESVAWPTLFEHWYTRFDPPWPDLITGNCSQQYHAYISHNATCSGSSGRCLATIMSDVAECLLQNTPEVVKADMAAASVLLGLLPTILSLAGSTTVEVGLVALRRPLLALLLGTASPAVNPLRTFEYGTPAKIMSREECSAEPLTITVYLRQLMSGMQYVLAFAAIFNVAMVIYSLSIRTYSISYQYVPSVLIWMCLAIFVHVLGAVVLRLRMKLNVENSPGISTALKNEFILSAYHPEGWLAFRQESYWFIFLSWATSVATIIHLAMGTLAFSSLLFINVQDALFVVSFIICPSYSLRSSAAESEPGLPVSGLSLRKQSYCYVRIERDENKYSYCQRAFKGILILEHCEEERL